MILLRAGNFHGGTATDTPAGPVAVGDEWHGNVVGAHAAIVGIVIGYAALINMTATTNQGTFQWQYLHQNNVDDLLDHELAPGPLALKLNFLLGTLALAIGDLEPLVVPENLLPSQ
ncbi:MAG: hypothetical protein QOI63_1105 [Thermoplasmata archaeon]|nr:hypothetical protein [Thermoplasmata archaeon]